MSDRVQRIRGLGNLRRGLTDPAEAKKELETQKETMAKIESMGKLMTDLGFDAGQVAEMGRLGQEMIQRLQNQIDAIVASAQETEE